MCVVETGGLEAIREAAPPFHKHTVSLLALWENICQSEAGLFKSLSIFTCELLAGDGQENKTLNQSKRPQPTRCVFLPPHSQKANISGDMQYFRWLWQKKASLVFQTRCLFIPRLASSSKKPMVFQRDAHWKYRCCLTAAKHFFASEASERAGSGARGC